MRIYPHIESVKITLKDDYCQIAKKDILFLEENVPQGKGMMHFIILHSVHHSQLG